MRHLIFALALLCAPDVFAQGTAGELHDRIALVCPIERVSLGKPTDKSAWVITFKPEATTQQRSDAQAIVDGWTDEDTKGDATKRKALALETAVTASLRVLALDHLLALHPGHVGLTAARDAALVAESAAWTAYDK